ncbi:MAG: hypothetical protein AMXMBFR33_57460 [Candidatus Xenobia bacterium]
MSKGFPAALLIALMLTSLAFGQPTEIRVFQLSNRPAASAAQSVRPLLSPAGTVLSDDQTNKLIVRDTPEVLGQIEKMIQAIDVAAPQVMIKIRFTGQTTGDGTTLSGGVVGQTNPDGSTRVTGYPYQVSSGSSSQTSSGEQSLMVMSGEEGRIEVGRQLTYVQPYWGLAQQYGLLPAGVIFQNVTTGFVVRPRVVGDVVTVQVAPWLSYQSGQGPGQIVFSEAASTVSLKSGDSIMLSGSSQNTSRAGGGVAGRGYGEKDRINAWSVILGGSSGGQTQSAGFYLTPTIIPDWSKE